MKPKNITKAIDRGIISAKPVGKPCLILRTVPYAPPYQLSINVSMPPVMHTPDSGSSGTTLAEVVRAEAIKRKCNAYAISNCLIGYCLQRDPSKSAPQSLMVSDKFLNETCTVQYYKVGD